MQSKWLCGCHHHHHHKEPSTLEAQDAVTTKERYVGEEGGDSEIGKWVPPIVKPRKRDFGGGGGSGLSIQFSDMTTINCC